MSDNNTKNHIENFVASVQTDNHADAKGHFDAVISSKVADAFESKKVELGQRITVPEETAPDEESKILGEAKSVEKLKEL